jgi:hypothetical protein
MHVYNDIFVEELVRRKHFASELVIRVLIIFAVILLSLAAFIFLRPFSPALTAVFIFTAWLSSRYTVVEYEYSLINGELEVDKIIGKRRRKRVLSVNCKLAREFVPEADAVIDRRNGTIIDASISAKLDTRWILTTTAMDRGAEYLIFSPSERLIDAIKLFLPKIKR